MRSRNLHGSSHHQCFIQGTTFQSLHSEESWPLKMSPCEAISVSINNFGLMRCVHAAEDFLDCSVVRNVHVSEHLLALACRKTSLHLQADVSLIKTLNF